LLEITQMLCGIRVAGWREWIGVFIKVEIFPAFYGDLSTVCLLSGRIYRVSLQVPVCQI